MPSKASPLPVKKAVNKSKSKSKSPAKLPAKIVVVSKKSAPKEEIKK